MKASNEVAGYEGTSRGEASAAIGLPEKICEAVKASRAAAVSCEVEHLRWSTVGVLSQHLLRALHHDPHLVQAGASLTSSLGRVQDAIGDFV